MIRNVLHMEVAEANQFDLAGEDASEGRRQLSDEFLDRHHLTLSDLEPIEYYPTLLFLYRRSVGGPLVRVVLTRRTATIRSVLQDYKNRGMM